MEIVTRDKWGAEPPKKAPVILKPPMKEIWVHHTVTRVTGDPIDDIRFVQQVAFGRGYSDISYSFLFHPDGKVYVGRGWGWRGAHTKDRNSFSYGFAFVGNYENMQPTRMQISNVREMIYRGQQKGLIVPGKFPTGGHRDLVATACPGTNVYNRLPDMRVPWIPPVVTPIPQPKPDSEEEKVTVIVKATNSNAQFLTDGISKRWIQSSAEKNALRQSGLLPNDETVRELDPGLLDNIPTVGASPP